ncbi:kelch-like protein 23 [Eucyclogobius newberryi]|uniref:kelch-like protein 23 n=1 Tax=Eucyclogobius newberryi TaxID=166745 RepID=UPI003B5ACACA
MQRTCDITTMSTLSDSSVQTSKLEEEELDVPEAEAHSTPDVMLQVQQDIFYVNRQQLALQSPYFRALFFGGGLESNRKSVVIKGVNLDNFKTLMEYSDKSSLPLDRDNVLGILETADFLQLEQARLLCCKFLERELHLSNCLGMMSYSWQLGCSQLYRAARQVALTHFSALITDDDFLSLSKDSVADLLASDDLTIIKDDLVLEAALQWVLFDPKREEHLLELIELVRPECLSVQFITELLSQTQSSDRRSKLISTLNEHYPASWSVGRSLLRTRGRETLFVLGGPHDQDTQTLYQFHPLSGRWQSCAPLERKNLTQYSVAAVGDSVIVTGGHFRDVLWYTMDWVLIYNCGNQRWTEGPALQKSRHSHCSVGLGDVLYVIGGSMDESLVNDVERLVLGSEGWVSVSPLIRPVERAAAAALGSNLYVVCGLDENGEAYGGVQRYVVEHDQWDVVSYSPHPRYDLVATELNGALYLFGGHSLRFDVDTDEWTLLEEDCLENKFFSGCTTVLGQIYLVSEKRVNRASPNMVLLDPYIDTCIEVDNTIPCSVPIRGCVTMKMTC